MNQTVEHENWATIEQIQDCLRRRPALWRGFLDQIVCGSIATRSASSPPPTGFPLLDGAGNPEPGWWNKYLAWADEVHKRPLPLVWTNWFRRGGIEVNARQFLEFIRRVAELPGKGIEEATPAAPWPSELEEAGRLLESDDDNAQAVPASDVAPVDVVPLTSAQPAPTVDLGGKPPDAKKWGNLVGVIAAYAIHMDISEVKAGQLYAALDDYAAKLGVEIPSRTTALQVLKLALKWVHAPHGELGPLCDKNGTPLA